MLCVVISGPTFSDAAQQVAQALPLADLIELRIDHFQNFNIDEIAQLKAKCSLPMIFTLRSPFQGGRYQGTEKQRLVDIQSLATLEPEYIDLETHVPKDFITKMTDRHPKIKFLISHHDFDQTPSLDAVLTQMKAHPAHLYKIAAQANSSLDAMRLLVWKKKSPENIALISMGELGSISRILGPIVGSAISYASPNDALKAAPGQLSVAALKELYRYHTLNPKTAIYGLIGDPVEPSPSNVTHNALLHEANIDAVYVKIQVKPTELKEFLRLAKELPFAGLSVTIPLKELVIPLIDEIDPKAKAIGAVNTLVFKDGKIKGYNTDCLGALDAIEEKVSVKGKKLVILGAGGAARAVVYEAVKRGADVTILNRDADRAHKLAQLFQCKSGSLQDIEKCYCEGYDILINCTPFNFPIGPEYLLPNTYLMDIKIRHKEDPIWKGAQENNCTIIYGYKMFVRQAMGQFSLWFDGIDKGLAEQVLENKTRSVIFP